MKGHRIGLHPGEHFRAELGLRQPEGIDVDKVLTNNTSGKDTIIAELEVPM